MRLSSALLTTLVTAAALSQQRVAAPRQLTPLATLSSIEPAHLALLSPVVGVCPIAFSVERTSATELLSAGSAARRSGSQGLRVFLTQPGARPIESVDLLVHAVSLKPRLAPAGQTAGDVTRSFHLQRRHGSRSLDRSEIGVEHVGAILSADLLAVQYSDGSTWQAPAEQACRAVPSLYLAVNAR